MTTDPASMRDEAALLRRSLDDARAEHARGELDDDALAAVVQRDEARLAHTLEQLAEDDPGDATPVATPVGPSTGTTAGPRRSRRLVLTSVLAVALAAATIGVVLGRPFAAAAPTRPLTTVQKVAVLLIQGELFVATGEDARAITAYDAVLRLEPRNAEAAIESGWLHYEVGLAAHHRGEVDVGVAMLRHAVVALAPRNGASHLYWGIVLLQHFHERAAAEAQVLRSASLPESKSEASLTSTMLYYFDLG